MDLPCKVESGLQLLARLSSRLSLENFYSELFDSGPRPNEVIEISNDLETIQPVLVCEIIAKVVLPEKLGGKNAGTAVVSTDGHFETSEFVLKLNQIIKQRLKSSETDLEVLKNEISNIIKDCLKRLFILYVYDSSQLLITMHALDDLVAKNCEISLVFVDTISAFYWSDRMYGMGILRMDSYVKKILKLIQTSTKEYKSVIMYTKPSYFVSKTNFNETNESCVKDPTLERINYRIYLKSSSEEHASHTDITQVIISNHQRTVVKNFTLSPEKLIQWL